MSEKNPACVRHYYLRNILSSNGWIGSAYVGVDQAGVIQYLSAVKPDDGAPIEDVKGVALPGFINGHSHAFQYAMAGMAEVHPKGSQDDFWSWREAMYQCALSFDPDQIQTVATALYIELLKKGYTHVTEFHYLHHDKDGKPYGHAAETSVSLLAAASIAGIKITLVPVFYQKGNFGVEAQPRQRRFIFSKVDDYFRLLEDAESVVRTINTAKLGFGVHSLRAADAADVLRIERDGPKDLPFHLHAAEQLKEISDCLAHLKQRPVEWLLNNIQLNDRFNLVHCTHMVDDEVARLAKSGANVVLCPGTEGNLGDGIFRLADYSKLNGNWCIGTDSHISLNPLEDLRLLDYTQRLITHKRNTFNDGGHSLLRQAFHSGKKAAGVKTTDFFEVGHPFDAVVYNLKSPLLSEINPNYLLSRILYTADTSSVLGTIVNGKWVVKNNYHDEQESVTEAFAEALKAVVINPK
jgi:formimidoylglutamate deiminase